MAIKLCRDCNDIEGSMTHFMKCSKGRVVPMTTTEKEHIICTKKDGCKELENGEWECAFSEVIKFNCHNETKSDMNCPHSTFHRERRELD